MAGVNKVILVGNLTRDPELGKTSRGESFCKFGIAVSGYTDNDTEFFNLVAFKRNAEVANQYLSKGKSVYIDGRIKTNKWVDKEGVNRTSIDIVVNTLTMLGGGEKKGRFPGAQKTKNRVADDDPFQVGPANDLSESDFLS